MKSTDLFKTTIQNYLQSRAKADSLFAVSFAKKGKNIDDCITYIMNTVKASGCNAFADDEIYSMAVHYYDEDKIEVGSPVKGTVIVNHHDEKSGKLKEDKPAKTKEKAGKIIKAEFNQLSLFQ